MTADLSAQAATISRFKKRRFLLALSEEDFRDRVVRPLLLRRGLKDGRDVCGPTEKGRDAIFVAENPLGLQEIWVVQTKKGRLNLSRKVTENIVEATTQLRTALNTRVVCPSTRERRFPDKAILCSSGTINDSARDHITDELKDPRIVFLDADDLITALDKDLPELWLDIDAAVLPYLRALKRVVEDIDEDLLPELNSTSRVGSATDRMYVSLFLNRTEIRLKRRSGKIEREPRLLEIPAHAIIGRPERLVLITGGAGSGKSTVLRRVAYTLIEQYLASSSSTGSTPHIPVLLKSSALAGPSDTLLQACVEEVTRLARSSRPAFAAEDLREGRVVVLIDALDELGDDKTRTLVLQKALDFHAAHPRCQVIITSRDYSFLAILQELARFTRFSLSPISLNQAWQLLEKIQRSRQLPVDASKEVMRRLREVHGFELNPLLVAVFAATSDFSRKDIPANITELFKKYTEMMLGRWSASKGLGQQFHAPLKDFLLRQVAAEMHRRRVTSLPIEEFQTMMSTALSARGHEAEIDVLMDEVLHQSGLFRVVQGSVEFRHLLLQEFFAGRGISSREYLETVIADDWWQRAIVFFFGDHPDDMKGLQSARGAVEPRTAPERYRAAITIGLALQACYLVEVTDKADVLKWVLQVLARSKKGFVEDATAGGVPPFMSFIWYYLFGKEAVTCNLPATIRSNLRSELRREAANRDELQTCEFWELVGMLETALGDAEIERLLRRYEPDDQRLLFALFLNLKFIEELRVSTPEEKETARRLGLRLSGRVASVARDVFRELTTLLLEVRRGQVRALESGETKKPDRAES